MDHKPIAVVGDGILDLFTYGRATRISAEAPVRVLDVSRDEAMPGGAGNVALNLVSLGSGVELFAVVSNDYYGIQFEATLKHKEIGIEHLVMVEDRPTTVKQRLLGPHGQMLCVDRQKRDAISTEVVEAFLAWLSAGEWQAIIVSDYSRGVVTAHLLQGVIEIARAKRIPVLVDARQRPLDWYARNARGCTLLTPNRNEAAHMLDIQRSLSSPEDIEQAGQTIAEVVECSVLLKLDDAGMMLFEHEDGAIRSKAIPPVSVGPVIEVSGAGDTVIATVTTELCRGASLPEAAKIAAIAAAIAVAKPGTAVVKRSELEHYRQKFAKKTANTSAESLDLN